MLTYGIIVKGGSIMSELNELRVEIALNIIEKKIIYLLKNSAKKDVNYIKEQLSILVDEREKICDLDIPTIDKVYDVYLKDLKK